MWISYKQKQEQNELNLFIEHRLFTSNNRFELYEIEWIRLFICKQMRLYNYSYGVYTSSFPPIFLHCLLWIHHRRYRHLYHWNIYSTAYNRFFLSNETIENGEKKMFAVASVIFISVYFSLVIELKMELNWISSYGINLRLHRRYWH